MQKFLPNGLEVFPAILTNKGFDLRLVPEKLAEPLRWQSPKMIFVNSTSDLFHEGVPDEYIEAVARGMMKAECHTYQILTKRSARMAGLLRGRLSFAAVAPHIWWGVSVENKQHGLPRLRDLQAAPASVRFLSVEPLLEGLGRCLNLNGIHWVIVGGESGYGARPLKKEWVTSIRDQCREARVPFFFKQGGGVQKKRAGRILDGQTHDGFPARMANPVSPVATALAWARDIQNSYANSRAELVQISA